MHCGLNRLRADNPWSGGRFTRPGSAMDRAPGSIGYNSGEKPNPWNGRALMDKKKPIEIDFIKSRRKVEPGTPGVVSKEELIALVRAQTGQSDASVRETVRLFAEYVEKFLEQQDQLRILMPDGNEMIIHRVDEN